MSEKKKKGKGHDSKRRPFHGPPTKKGGGEGIKGGDQSLFPTG